MIAHIALHLPFSEVSILPDKNTLGRCTYKLPPHFNPEINNDLQTQQRCEHIIIAALSGHAAELRFMGRSNWPQSSHDLSLAAYIASYIAGSSKAVSAYITWLCYKAEGLIYQPIWWVAVEAVASELLQRRRMSSQHARKIIRETKEAFFRKLSVDLDVVEVRETEECIITKYSVKHANQGDICKPG